MAVLDTTGGQAAVLCTALGGNVDSTNTASRPIQPVIAGGALVIASVAGGTPTVTVNILGSVDGTNFFNIPYALVATPRTFVVTAITITSTTTTTYLLQENIYYRFVKINMSANTNVTLTATAYL